MNLIVEFSKRSILIFSGVVCICALLLFLNSCGNDASFEQIENQEINFENNKLDKVEKLVNSEEFNSVSVKISKLSNLIARQYMKLSKSEQKNVINTLKEAQNEKDSQKAQILFNKANLVLKFDTKIFDQIHADIASMKNKGMSTGIDKKTLMTAIIKSDYSRKTLSLKSPRLKTETIEEREYYLDQDCVNSCRATLIASLFACVLLPPPADLVCIVGFEIAYEYCVISCRVYV